ncbi:MAG: hypothetical protein AB7R00_00170 [Kofleriaceae bacterium]
MKTEHIERIDRTSGGCVKGGVHLHVAVAVKGHDYDYDHDYDHDHYDAGGDQRKSRNVIPLKTSANW